MIYSAMLMELSLAVLGAPPDTAAPCPPGLIDVVDVINRYGKLSHPEEYALETAFVSYLVRRWQILGHLIENPQLSARPIVAPIFVIGLPRTGTTLTLNLLSQDAGHRPLMNWEVYTPLPPPTAETLRSNPRCLAQKRRQQIILKYRPEAAVAHWEFADEPTECQQLLVSDFKMGFVEATLLVPNIIDYSLASDATSSYQFHRQALQVLQTHTSGRWLLKSPLHSAHLPELLAVYPDAKLIWLHRDPYRVLASNASLRAQLLGYGSMRDTDPKASVYKMVDDRTETLRRLIAAAQTYGNRIYHLHYADLLAEPLHALKQLYAWLGTPLTDETADAVRRWLQLNPQHKQGAHRYSLQRLGLERARLPELFAEYAAAYRIALEPGAD